MPGWRISTRAPTSRLPYYEGSHFYVPVSHDVIEGLATFFGVPDKYSVDDRGVAFTLGFSSAKHLGAGQFT